MNYYIGDILFLGFAILTIFLCAKRGLFLTLLKCCKFFLAIGAAYLWGNALGTYLGEAFLHDPIRNAVFNGINDMYLNATSGFNVESVMESIPPFLLNDAVRAQLESLNGTGLSLVNSITDTITTTATSVIGAVLGFLLVFVVAFLVLSIVYILLKGLRSKLKLIGTVDTILGAAFGFIWACVVMFAVASVLKFFFGTEDFYTQSILVKFFGDSAILEQIKFLNVAEWLNTIQTNTIQPVYLA